MKSLWDMSIEKNRKRKQKNRFRHYNHIYTSYIPKNKKNNQIHNQKTETGKRIHEFSEKFPGGSWLFCAIDNWVIRVYNDAIR